MRKFTFVLCAATFAASAVGAAEHTVTMAGASYAPATLVAAQGDTIRFVNDDGIDHDVFVPTAGYALDLGKQEPGQEKTLTLGKVGEFKVECVFHSGMELMVEVN